MESTGNEHGGGGGGGDGDALAGRGEAIGGLTHADEHGTGAEVVAADALEEEQEGVGWPLAVRFAGFGLCSWLLINGIWAELAGFARELPEGYAISVFIVFAMTLANVFPLGISYWSRQNPHVPPRQMVYPLLLGGCVVAILLAICWGYTVRVGNGRSSLALFFLVFFAGGISASSNVVFYPFVAEYPKQCTVAMSTGSGLSGLMTGVLGIVQDIGNSDRRFPITVFFVLVALGFAFSTVCFLQLPDAQAVKNHSRSMSGESLRTIDAGESKQHTSGDTEDDEEDGNSGQYGATQKTQGGHDQHDIHRASNEQQGSHTDGSSVPALGGDRTAVGPVPSSINATASDSLRPSSSPHSGTRMSSRRLGDHYVAMRDQRLDELEHWFFQEFRTVMGVQVLIAALGFGVVPALLGTTMGKLPQSSTAIMWAVVLTAILDPFARSFASRHVTEHLVPLTALAVGIVSPFLYLAFVPIDSSGDDDNNDGDDGDDDDVAKLTGDLWVTGLAIICYVSFLVTFAYVITCTYMHVHARVNAECPNYTSHAYRWMGLIAQGGALVGSVLTVILLLAGA